MLGYLVVVAYVAKDSKQTLSSGHALELGLFTVTNYWYSTIMILHVSDNLNVAPIL